jgi:hypothetical protein
VCVWGLVIAQLKAYGYTYMAKLFQQEQEKEAIQPQSSSQFASPTNHPSEWNYEDKILLETLLLRFTPKEPNRWKKIASIMSNKTAHDIRKYFENNYRSSIENSTSHSNTKQKICPL